MTVALLDGGAAGEKKYAKTNARNRHLHPLLLDLSLAGKGQMTATRSWSRDMLGLLALLLLLPAEVVGMAVRPKLTVFRTGPQLRPPARETPAADAGARDVMLKLYDISSPPLVSAFQALAFKEGFWFPKLSIGVGRSCWSYDGEPEALHPLSPGPSPLSSFTILSSSLQETYDGILERVSGGKPLRTINCGPTSKSDAQIAQIIAEMGATDYTQDRVLKETVFIWALA